MARSKSFIRETDAERWLQDQRLALSLGTYADPALGSITFADWVEKWSVSLGELRPTTQALNLGVARNHLLPRFGGWPLNRITPQDVKRMVAEEVAAGSLSASAVRRHVLVLSSILGAAVDDGRIGRNPCRGLRLPTARSRAMRFLEPHEVAALADAIGAHYRPLVFTAAYVGLRWGELAGLQVDHVDLLRRQIRVDRQLLEVAGELTFGPPKTSAGIRTVSVPTSLCDVLGPHFGSPPVHSSGLAFPTPSGTPMRRSNFRTTWRRAVSDVFAGTELETIVFHELRHTSAALAIAQGAHPLAIKERLGHSSITVTMDTYGGLFPGIDEGIAEGLDAVLARSLAARLRPDEAPTGRLSRSNDA